MIPSYLGSELVFKFKSFLLTSIPIEGIFASILTPGVFAFKSVFIFFVESFIFPVKSIFGLFKFASIPSLFISILGCSNPVFILISSKFI